MATKFTFKTEKPTGRYKSFGSTYHYIKLDGKMVGQIVDGSFRIWLQIIKPHIMEDGNPNCIWRNSTLAYKPTSLDDAKSYLNVNFDKIIKLNLYKQD